MVRIVHVAASGPRVVDIDIDDPSRTVADLCRALEPGADRGSEPVIDGAPVTSDAPLSAVAICEGSVVDTTAEPITARAPVRTLAVVGGVWAGSAFDAARPLVVGRDPAADVSIPDPALSGRHLQVDPDGVSDLGSHNGTAADGHPVSGVAAVATDVVIRAGVSRFRCGLAIDDRPLSIAHGLGARGGVIPFNRPPRVSPDTGGPEIACPSTRPVQPRVEPLSIAGIVLPVIAGAVVAVLFSPYMAIFAALGPVLTVGTWLERRRRARREHHTAVAEFTAALSRLAERLPAERVREIRRRRAQHPDPAEVVRRASGPSVRVWERRPGDPDAFAVAVGAADEPFAPVLRPSGGDPPAAESAALVDVQPTMPDVPLAVDLGPGRVVGLLGDRAAALAIARSLVLQMATHHGPADLSIAVGADHPGVWAWTTWLPHTADHASGRRGVSLFETHDGAASAHVLAGLSDRALLVMIDGADPFQGRGTIGRHLLCSPAASAIVLVGDPHRLPARCETLIRVDPLGRITLLDPRRADRGVPALGWGLSGDIAGDAARRLARLDDPELPLVGAGIPGEAPLLGLLGIGGDDPAEIDARWRQVDGTARLAVPLGADGDGPVVLDLVADGPHVLIGGTTGAGKSELLRSLVAGLAATADPAHVAMVLIDYKGGAAFDCCADLPHVVGVVTDLDTDLAARALRCLNAELQYRERRLRDVGADDMGSFRVVGAAAEPLPRLVVVVDEFASLAADLPDFVESLVGIAQRGRSLGVHLILATQRPAGVITDDIRANTACRIALRVTDRNDSLDVVDAPDAAAIPRDRPGRSVARFGPGDLVPFQAARVTGHSLGSTGIAVRTGLPVAGSADGPTDLRRLVTTIGAAHSARGGAFPRPPWPPPLPVDLPCGDEAAGNWFLVDDPDRQRQYADGWDPADGHLVVVGAPGAGATTTLVTAAIIAGDKGAHVHAIDLDGGGVASLAGLPGAGTVAGPADRERRIRLLRWLDDEIGRRRAIPTTSTDPRLLLVVDDFGGLSRSHDPVREAVVHDRFARIWADGPAVGITVAVSLRRVADLPPALAATAGTVLLHRTADPSDVLRFGLKQSTELLPPGRAIRVTDAATLQVMRHPDGVEAAVAARASDPVPVPAPHDVGELAAEIVAGDSVPAAAVSERGAELVFAIRDRDLAPCVVTMHPGEHLLVLGPARSGRTNTLAAIAAAAPDAAVIGDDLGRRCGVVPTPVDAIAAMTGRSPLLVLVDDALDIEDPTGELSRLVTAPPPGLHLVVAARPDHYRSAYGHWAAEVKASRLGVLLRPEPLDGDLLGHQLPARLDLPAWPGRGVVVADGMAEVVQVVLADGHSAS